jgi:hypothetical protein
VYSVSSRRRKIHLEVRYDKDDSSPDFGGLRCIPGSDLDQYCNSVEMARLQYLGSGNWSVIGGRISVVGLQGRAEGRKN